ncbi:class I SAM-dependent methyltransferase [Actinomadura decatromicini]|uniref:Class I SAM-dependent methyltransferase n=1 Tax=Actinomadura decatromicini TaxID=2604572 RepID=A0A5D3FXD0_9ACTN|nr:class I SAM-dependent methyltransferase [Actinomadura decatromicini]TYK52814.1 class I SAM-dependent methyltransferase [Actinomadura decatromicini]
MSSSLSDRTGYWDRYAERQEEASSPEEALKNAFGWTQYPGHGPGDELLGDPVTALELGFGRGDAVAALAAKGIAATGLDLSPVQCDQAREHWGHLPGACFEHGDAVEYLARIDRQWDAIYSIWGALWFTDPDDLLPRVHDRLVSGGRVVFSHAPAVPKAYGVQGMYGDGLTGRQVWIHRWAYEPETWADILTDHGFAVLDAHVESALEPDHVGTLIVQALKP